MNIELLNVRIYIQKNEVISDAIGNRRNVWKDYYTCYATVSAEAGKESTDAGLVVDDSTARKWLFSPLLDIGYSLEMNYMIFWQ